MKKHNTTKQQKGFFDLGISLAILALSGAFVYATAPDQDERVATQEPQMEIVANLEADNGTVEVYK